MLKIKRLYSLKNLSLYRNPVYSIYIHLKDHNKKITPKQTRTSLSYMNLKNKDIDELPIQQQFTFSLKSYDQIQLEKKLFEDYKTKIIQAKIDEEQQEQIDPLWGQQQPPVHYYKYLNARQATHMSHSLFYDIIDIRKEVVNSYFTKYQIKKSIEEVKQYNDLAKLALFYRQTDNMNRKDWYQIEKRIGNKFHLLTKESLIMLNYACMQSPKQCTPQFRKIIRDILIEDLDTLTPAQMISVFESNRFDKYRLIDQNLQLKIFQKLQKFYQKFSFNEKIDWLFLFTDCRNTLVPRKAYNRFINQKRDIGSLLLYQLNIFDEKGRKELQSLQVKDIKKLIYSLTRMKLINITYFIDPITARCSSLLNNAKLSTKDQVFLFNYLSQIQNGKGINNIELLTKFKQNIITNWAQVSKINQLKSLWGMANMGLYDQNCQQLYKQTQMQADDTVMAYFCKLQLMNSSQRQWQVIHFLAQLQTFPVAFFQDYKRFYNSLKVSTEWNLGMIKDKLANTEGFVNSARFQSSSMNKKTYKNIKQFLNFTQSKLPNGFEIGAPINNLQIAQFAWPQYQISIDIATDVQFIPGTNQLKASAQNKIKSLQNLGWKHCYILQSQVNQLQPLQLFDHIYNESQQYIESQKQVIQNLQQYRAYELELIRNDRFWKQLQGDQIQVWKNNPEEAAKILSEQQEQQKVENFAQRQNRGQQDNEGDTQIQSY